MFIVPVIGDDLFNTWENIQCACNRDIPKSRLKCHWKSLLLIGEHKLFHSSTLYSTEFGLLRMHFQWMPKRIPFKRRGILILLCLWREPRATAADDDDSNDDLRIICLAANPCYVYFVPICSRAAAWQPCSVSFIWSNHFAWTKEHYLFEALTLICVLDFSMNSHTCHPITYVSRRSTQINSWFHIMAIVVVNRGTVAVYRIYGVQTATAEMAPTTKSSNAKSRLSETKNGAKQSNGKSYII